MLVKECMTNQVQLGNPEMTLQEAAQRMRDGDFGALPIAENERLVGVVTDRDIAIRAVAEGVDVKQARVRNIMSAKVLYCYEDQTLDEVAQNLGSNQVRRLPVLNRQKRLVGILSLGDLAKSQENKQEAEQALTKISEKGTNNRNQEARF